jgi:hypothetical protein
MLCVHKRQCLYCQHTWHEELGKSPDHRIAQKDVK